MIRSPVALVVPCVVFAFLAGTALAGRPYEFGVKAGLSFASVSGEGSEDRSGRTGVTFGMTASVKPFNGLRIQAELLFSMRGTKEKLWFIYGGRLYYIPVTDKMNYFELPVLVRWSMPDTGPVKPILFVGPSFAYKVLSKSELDPEGIARVFQIDNVKSTDVGLVVGGGVDFIKSKGRITLDIRYTFGLSGFLFCFK